LRMLKVYFHQESGSIEETYDDARAEELEREGFRCVLWTDVDMRGRFGSYYCERCRHHHLVAWLWHCPGWFQRVLLLGELLRDCKLVERFVDRIPSRARIKAAAEMVKKGADPVIAAEAAARLPPRKLRKLLQLDGQELRARLLALSLWG